MSIFSRILSHIPGFRNDASISETSSVTGKKTQHTAERSENKTTSVDRKSSKSCLNNATKSAQHKVKKQHTQHKKTHHHNKQGKVLSHQGNQPEKTHLKDAQLAQTEIEKLENFDANYTFIAIQQLSDYTKLYPDFAILKNEDKKNIILYILKNFDALLGMSISKEDFDEIYSLQKIDTADVKKLQEVRSQEYSIQNTLLNNLSKIFAGLATMDFSIFKSPSNEYQQFRKDTLSTLDTLNNLTNVLYKLTEFQENNKTPNKYLIGRLNQISEKAQFELIKHNIINEFFSIIDNPTPSKKELKSQTIFNHYNLYRKYYDEKYNKYKRSLPLLNPKLERSPEKNLNNLKSNIQALQQQGIINDSQAKNFLAEISRKINQLALEKFVKDFKSIPKNLQEKNFKKYLSNMTTYVKEQGNPMNLSTFLEDQKNSKVVPATFFVNFRNFISNLKDSDITKDLKNNLLKNSPNVPVFPIENPHPKPKVVKPAFSPTKTAPKSNLQTKKAEIKKSVSFSEEVKIITDDPDPKTQSIALR